MDSPFERAFSLHPSPEEFRNVLEAHLLHGRIISTDRVFLMVRPVWRGWGDDRLLDPWQADEAGDCWYVWDLAGDIAQLPHIPEEWMRTREYVASHTNGRIRRMRGARFLSFRKARQS